MTFIAAHRGVFYLPTPGMPSDLESVRCAVTYAALAKQNDSAFAATTPNPDVNALHRTIDQGPMTCVRPIDLASALCTDVARINGLRPNLISVPADPDRLAILDRLNARYACRWVVGQRGDTEACRIRR